MILKIDQQIESQETDVSDTTEESNEVEQPTESQETDVSSSISGVADEESPQTTTSHDIPPQLTDTSSLAAVTDEQTPNTVPGGITESQESNPDPQIDEAKIQQVADKISEHIIQEGALPTKISTDLKNTLTKELQNNPDGAISKSIEILTGIEQSMKIEYGDGLIKQFAEKIIEEYPEKEKFEVSLLAGILSSVARNIWKDAIGFELTKYNEKGDITNIGLTVIVNKSSDSKSDKNNEHDDDNKQDIDCDNIKEKNIKVPPGDPNDLDRDGDGIGCESNNDDNDNNKNHHYIKKIIKYQGNKCSTQSDSIPLAGKIPPKTPILLGDFYPCELSDGRATLHLPNTQDLQIAMIHLDKKDGNHEAALVNMQKIQSLNRGSTLFVVNFNDQFQGEDPITGKPKTIKDVNAIALYNKARQTLDFNSGNSIAISAVLKS